MWVTNSTNRSAVALRMVTSLLFPRKRNTNTALDAGGRRARVSAGWKMKTHFGAAARRARDAMDSSAGWSRGRAGRRRRAAGVARCLAVGETEARRGGASILRSCCRTEDFSPTLLAHFASVPKMREGKDGLSGIF